MRVGEVMSAPVRTIAAGETAEAAWEQMRVYGTRHLVVIDLEGRVAGIVSGADLGGRHGAALRANRSVSDLMTAQLIAATPDTTVREAANLMRGHGIDCLPVIDAGRVTGIVTSLDLLELLGRGAVHPRPPTERWVLKERGPRPRAQTQARATSRARHRVG